MEFQARKGYPALLHTCKQINREAYGIFLKAVRLDVMPALGSNQVYVRGFPTSNRTHYVRNLKIRMGTWLETNHVIFWLFMLFEMEDLQRVVVKIGSDIFTWHCAQDGTHIGTTVQVEESKRVSPDPLYLLCSALLVEARHSPYLGLFMMYVSVRGGSAWKRATTPK